MFAVIKTGGKQYKVAKNDVITVEKLVAEAGATVELDNVLMIGEAGQAPKIAANDLAKATVFAEVLEQTRADKIIVFKKKRRQNYRRKAGHRQDITVLRITGISATGSKPKTAPKKAAAKAETKTEAETEAETDSKPKTEAKTEAKSKAEATKE